jgi:hypothetical protein
MLTINKNRITLATCAFLSTLALAQCESPSEPEEKFTCAGKTVCKEMTSCAEARYYLTQCGVTTLDGDSDGIPCEVEQCGH